MLPIGFPPNLSATALAMLRRMAANPDWKRLPPSSNAQITAQQSVDFLRGGADCMAGKKIGYVFFFNEEERRIRGLAHFGSHTEGPKGYVHGGAAAALLDVAMGGLCWWSKLEAVTGKLTVSYRNLLPLNTTILVDSSVLSAEEGSRKVIVSACLHPLPNSCDKGVDAFTEVSEGEDPDSTEPSAARSKVYSEAEALFIRMPDHPSSRVHLASKL